MKEEATLGKIQNPFDTTINWREFACGWGAALINISITYPVNKVIFRQMLHGVKAKSAVQQLHGEGIYFLYRGMLPPLIQKTLSMSIMFGVYDECRRPLLKTSMNPYACKALAGIIAGTTEAILMPLERIQTLLIDQSYHDSLRNTVHAFEVVGQYSFREFYRGLVPILFRNGPSNALYFILREEVNERFPQQHSPINKAAVEFISGAVIGASLSTLFYPLNVVKIRMQTQLGGKFVNFVTTLLLVYRERGGKITNLYKGVGINTIRAFISWGVMNTAYEYMKKVLY